MSDPVPDALAPRRWARLVEVEGYQVILSCQWHEDDECHKLHAATSAEFGVYETAVSFTNDVDEQVAHIMGLIDSEGQAIAERLIAQMRQIVGDNCVYDEDSRGETLYARVEFEDEDLSDEETGDACDEMDDDDGQDDDE